VLSPIYTLQKLTATDRTAPLRFMITVSALGKMVLPGFSLYDATKFALDGFVRTYRMEKPRQVKIIPVYPVANFTPFFRKAGGDGTPIPLLARQFPFWTALCMELGLRVGARAVYPSLVFLVRCLLARVTPIDVLIQLLARVRFHFYLKRRAEKQNP
jgi:NAD(P)-dependent dehydrogenase (short-subunit alcohol dehydrogenase family)